MAETFILHWLLVNISLELCGEGRGIINKYKIKSFFGPWLQYHNKTWRSHINLSESNLIGML